MGHFVDIKLLAEPEFPTVQLMAGLYSKLHLAIVALKTDAIAVSFPEYSEHPVGLGSVLRIVGPETVIQQLLATAWLGGMRDHVSATSVAPVPQDATARVLQRVQVKSSADRLRRRRMRRHGITADQAADQIPNSAAERLNLPFVQLSSGSTGQRFRLYFQLKQADRPQSGQFNAYGLSNTATIPWF